MEPPQAPTLEATVGNYGQSARIPVIVVLAGPLRDPGRDVGREAPHGGSADVVRGRAGGGRGRRACGERRAGSKRSPYTGCMIHVNIFT